MVTWDVINADCLDAMPELDAASVDAIVCDPPYGLSFMGRDWDHGVPGERFWAEALRVAKPGAHLLAFGGTRTFHRLACAIEDAGWEVRDCLMWLYGSGFPKSLDVSKAIDKAAGAEREVVETIPDRWAGKGAVLQRATQVERATADITAPATDLARQWQGWGTALKPAWEPIIMARKPLCGTVAQNVTTHGTGALNIEGCRVGTEEFTTSGVRNAAGKSLGWKDYQSPDGYAGGTREGRWPANVCLDPDAAAILDEQAGDVKGCASASRPANGKNADAMFAPGSAPLRDWYGDSGGPSRFFYTAKASKADRNSGLAHMPERVGGGLNSTVAGDSLNGRVTKQQNVHPTVKPTDLMRWLVRLVTPPGGLVLDPFTGSGSTGKAAMLEGFRFVGIEREPEYAEIARARIEHAAAQSPLFTEAAPCSA